MKKTRKIDKKPDAVPKSDKTAQKLTQGLDLPVCVNERSYFLKEGEAGVFVNPLSDAGFKILLERSGVEKGQPGLKTGELLRDMINVLGEGMIAPVDEITFMNNEVFADTVDVRKTVFDIHFVDGTHRFFVVEMQNEEDETMIDRIHNYVSRVHSNALEKGKDFSHDQAEVIGIVVANFCLDKQPKAPCISTSHLTVKQSGEIISNLTTFLTIELPKFKKKINELNGKKDVYLYILKNMGRLKIIPPPFDNDDYRPMFELARIANLKKEDKKMYDESREFETKWRRVMKTNIKKGIKKGVEEGLEKELEKGIEKGIVQTKREMIESLLEDNSISIEQIAKASKLPIHEIVDIRDALLMA